MREIYILAAAIQEDAQPQTAFQQFLASGKILERWVDQIHWIGGQSEEFSTDKPVMIWPDTPLMGAHLIQSTAAAIMNQEMDLVVMGYSTLHFSAALCLSSPSVVGRYNILPSLRLTSWKVLAGSQTTLTSGLIEYFTEIAPDDAYPACLAAVNMDPLESVNRFPKPVFLNTGGIHGAVQTAQWLLENKQTWGCTLDCAGHTGLVSLIERI